MYSGVSRGSTHQSLHNVYYDSESSSEASEEEEQQERRPVSLFVDVQCSHGDVVVLLSHHTIMCVDNVFRNPMLTYPVNIGRFKNLSNI